MTAVILAAVLAAAPVQVDGLATWYDAPSGAFAAGPALRAVLGSGWRGTRVRVEVADGRYVVGTLSDWCACGRRNGRDTVLDLPKVDFASLADPGRGVIAVSVRVGTATGSPGPAIAPPATDSLYLSIRPHGAMVPA